jgi:gliding motility-associated protein GldL
MSRKKGGFAELLFKTIMPKVYGIGASVVIIGAMFKINHFPGANEMLIIGLSVEAVIFFLSSFEPSHAELDWTKVYPQLADDFSGGKPTAQISNKPKQSLNDVFGEQISPEVVEKLGQGMKKMADSASRMSDLADAAVATNDYAKNVSTASKSLLDMNKSYAATATAMGQMASATQDSQAYHTQVQEVTKNLGALNAVYEMELKDANTHLKAMNKFYTNMTEAVDSMGQVGANSKKFTEELNKLTGNLTALNSVYGSMLTAMRGGGSGVSNQSQAQHSGQ